MEDSKRRTDEELVTLSQTGDKQAEEELLVRHVGLVRGCARRFFLYGGETEDLLQEGMIGLYRAIGDFKTGNGSFKNFAYLCVSRRIIDAVKVASRKRATYVDGGAASCDEGLASKGLSPEEVLILSDDKRELWQRMSRVLSDFEFKIITMYIDGLSCAEICEATGKASKSVDNAIQRSKRKLQEILTKK